MAVDSILPKPELRLCSALLRLAVRSFALRFVVGTKRIFYLFCVSLVHGVEWT